MVKILIRNERLYLERAGKETELDSTTIFHHKAQGKYQIKVFPVVENKIKCGQTFTQKTYPLVSINLEKARKYTPERPFYTKMSKHYYINYYVV